MDDPILDPQPDPALSELRDQVRSLRQLVKLALISAFIVTAGVSLFLFQQTRLMKRQIDNQQRALAESQQKERDVVLKGIEVFRQYGARDPLYASNVLVRFGLTALVSTNAPAPAKR